MQSVVEDYYTLHLPRDPATVKYKWQFTSQTGKLNDPEPVLFETIEKVQL